MILELSKFDLALFRLEDIIDPSDRLLLAAARSKASSRVEWSV